MTKRPTGPKPRKDLATGVSEASCFGGGAMASGAGGISTGGIVGPAMDTRGADRLFRLSCDVELVADGRSIAAGAPTRGVGVPALQMQRGANRRSFAALRMTS